MEMKDIDLTKCTNCRFRAKVDGKEIEGRIAVDGDYLRFFYSNGDIYSILISCYQEHGADYFDDLEIVTRDPETYRDWQVGDIIGLEDENGEIDIIPEHLCRVIFRSGELVAIAENYSAEEADINGCYTCSQLFREGWRLVLTDIEQQIIEEKRKQEYEPQDGDIVAWKDKDDDGDPAISIYKERYRGYATIFANGLTQYSGYFTLAMNIIRPATDEEKQRLFDAMANEGKRWNAEKKVVEDIPKPYEFSEFRKGDVVLYRDYGGFWEIGVFVEMRYGYDKYVTTTDGVDECGYRECIPYNERTMHLLGTTEDYKEGD